VQKEAEEKWTTYYLNPSKQEFEEPYEFYVSE
jgi:hypothetical protein